MDEQRIQAYLGLIEQLLTCANGNWDKILNANQALIDTGLMNVMKVIAENCRNREQEYIANSLDNFRQQLTPYLENLGGNDRKSLMNFLKQVLLAVSEDLSPQNVYPLLEQNLDKLTLELLSILEAWSRSTIPGRATGTLVNFGNLIQKFPKGSRMVNIELAITCYHEALRVVTFEKFPEEWAVTQNSLGTAYRIRLIEDKAQNIEEAIKCHHETLRVWTFEKFPENWAIAQDNLGNAYCERLIEDKAQNIEEAIKYYKLALKVRTFENFPVDWAKTQYNLGTAYTERLRKDKAQNIEEAIKCYKLALKVGTFENFSVDWGMTQNNLGIAYSERLIEDKVQNIEEAIKCYKLALKVRTFENFPVDWAITQNNLGNAYRDRLIGDEAQNIEEAIKCYKLALKVRTFENFPVDWAGTQNNLGIAYRTRLIEDKTQNIEEAIKCYKLALKVRTFENFPVNWAQTQNNLGNAYRDRLIEDEAQNIEEAIKCYKLALKVRTPLSFSYDCLQTGRNLGNLGFKERMWEIAIEGYAKAIDAVENIRTWATDEQRREEIQEQAIESYFNIVQAYINWDECDERYSKALEYVERSRSQRLLALMHTNDLYKYGDIPDEVRALQDEYDRIQGIINAINQNRYNPRPDNLSSTTLRGSVTKAEEEHLRSLATEQIKIWEEIYKLDAVTAEGIKFNPLNINQISDLLKGKDKSAALLDFFSTDTDTYIFILQHTDNGIKVDLHPCKGQGISTLHEWIIDEWIIPNKTDNDNWRDKVPSTLKEMSERIKIDELITNHLQGIKELLIIPHFYLHQIPFTALPINSNKSYLGDLFTIRYAPSAQVLNFCQIREQNNPITPPLTYGIVEGASDDVLYAAFQGRIITEMFNIPQENRLRGVEQATSKAYKNLASKVNVFHAYHHASFNFENPLNAGFTLSNGDITLAQVLKWRLPNLLEVFLSCCETGYGISTRRTDDIFTLAGGFLCAGARTAIASLWSVDQLAAALVCIFYYEYLAVKLDKGETCDRPTALQAAQKRLRDMTRLQLCDFAITWELQPYLDEQIAQAFAAKKLAEQLAKKTPTPEFIDKEKAARAAEYNLNIIDEWIQKPKNEQVQQVKLFASPYYWAAFTCQGLG